MNIVILGAGRMGAALATTLAPKNQINSWDIDPTKVPGQKPLAEIIPSADLIFLTIPSWVLRKELTTLQPLLKKTTPLVCFSKGIEAESNKTVDEIFAAVLPEQPFALFTGPMMAEEIQNNHGGLGLIATTTPTIFTTLTDLFAGTQIDVVLTADVHGAALSSVLKNIYSMALGIANGLDWGSNRKGYLTTLAIQEMEKIVAALGGRAETALSLAGLGDLVCTGFSPFSHNRAMGEELLKTGGCGTQSESCVSVLPITQLITNLNDYPLLATIHTAFLTPADIKASFEALLPTR